MILMFQFHQHLIRRACWPAIVEAASNWPGENGQTRTLHGQYIVTEVKEQILQSLLRFAHVRIQPVPQVRVAQEWAKHGDIAITSGIAAPGEKSVSAGCQRRDEQETTQRAACKRHQQHNQDGNGGGDDDDTAPLLKEATSRQGPFNQDAMPHNGVAHQQNDERDRSTGKHIQHHQVKRNSIQCLWYGDRRLLRVPKPADHGIDADDGQRGGEADHEYRGQEEAGTGQMPGERVFFQLLYIRWIIPEGVNERLKQGEKAARAQQCRPEAADSAQGEPGSDGTEGDVAKEKHRQQDDGRKQANTPAAHDRAIGQQTQGADKGEHRLVDDEQEKDNATQNTAADK